AGLTSNRKWFLIGGGVLLLADLVVSFGLDRRIRASEGVGALFLQALAENVGRSQLVLAAMALVFGRWPLLVRLAYCLGAVAEVSLLQVQPQQVAGWAFMSLLFRGIDLSFFRLAGFEIVRIDQPSSLPAESLRSQFSLRQVFALTTAVAIVTG